MSRSFDADKHAPEPKEPKQQTCQAAGCPLFGSRASSPGSDKRWCYLHYGQDLKNFPRITDRIIRSRPMIEHIYRLKRATSKDIVELPPYLVTYPNNPKFSKRDDETFGHYVVRLEFALKNAVLQDVEKEHLENAKEMVSGFAEAKRVNERSWDEDVEKKLAVNAEEFAGVING